MDVQLVDRDCALRAVVAIDREKAPRELRLAKTHVHFDCRAGHLGQGVGDNAYDTYILFGEEDGIPTYYQAGPPQT